MKKPQAYPIIFDILPFLSLKHGGFRFYHFKGQNSRGLRCFSNTAKSDKFSKSFLARHFSFYGWKNPKTNKSLTVYILSFFVFLTFSLIWGLVYITSMYILSLGILLNGIFFLLIIQISYSKSLSRGKSRPFQVQRILAKDKQVLIPLLKSFVIGVSLVVGIPIYVDFILPLLYTPGYALSYLHIVVSVLVTLAIIYKNYFKNILPTCLNLVRDFKFKVIKSVFARNKKLFLFFKKNYPKTYLTYYLAFISFFINTSFLYIPFCILSLRWHNGVELYFFIFVTMLTTFFVSLPSFRTYVFNKYDFNYLRLLYWNGFGVLGTRAIGQGSAGAGAIAGLALGFKTLERYNQRKELEHGIAMRRIINEENARIRLQDPDGVRQGKYQDLGPTDALPAHLDNKINLTQLAKDILFSKE